MSAPIPFAQSHCLRSFDIDEMQQYLNCHVDDREVRSLSRPSKKESIVSIQPLGGSLLFGACWSGQVHIRSGELTSVHLVMPLSGGIDARSLDEPVGPQDLLLLAPGQSADLVWYQDTRAIVATLDPARLMGRLGVVGTTKQSAGTMIVRACERTAKSARSLLGGIAAQHDLARGHLSAEQQALWEALIMDCLGGHFANADEEPKVLPASVKRTRDWVMANLEQPIAIEDMLAVAGVSRRSLENGFRQYLECSPARFVMRSKLAQVRERLLADGEESISELAYRFGFSDQSHLCRQYRREYGETPTVTLARR